MLLVLCRSIRLFDSHGPKAPLPTSYLYLQWEPYKILKLVICDGFIAHTERFFTLKPFKPGAFVINLLLFSNFFLPLHSLNFSFYKNLYAFTGIHHVPDFPKARTYVTCSYCMYKIFDV